MKKKNTGFYIAEALLIGLSLFFAFGLVGYTTIALVLAALAVVAALYRVIAITCARTPVIKKRLDFVLSAMLSLAVTALVCVEIPIIASAKTESHIQAPYLIVLGAGVNGETPSLSLLNRLEAARDYMELYPQSVAVVSGSQGRGENISEAECMRRWLEKQGIAPQRIIMEDKAASTYENIAFSLELIAKDGGDKTGQVAIVSSEYHLYRGKYIAADLGARPVGVAGHTSYPILMVNYFIREAAAVAVMWLRGVGG